MFEVEQSVRLSAAATLLLLLTACDASGVIGDTAKQGVRQSAIQACIAWAPESPIAAAAGVGAERLCACAADRIMAQKNLSDLAALRPDRAEIQAAVVQCLADVSGTAPDNGVDSESR